LPGWVTQAAGERLPVAQRAFGRVAPQSRDARDFKPIPLGITVRGNLTAKLRQIESRNILGMVQGSDPKLRSEYVMYSAHWDHLGSGAAGERRRHSTTAQSTTPPASESFLRSRASLHRCGKRLAGPQLFAFWTAEESGSEAPNTIRIILSCPPQDCCQHQLRRAIPVGPHARHRTHGRRAHQPLALAQQTAKQFDLEIAPDPRPEQGSYYRSDHFMMARIGVPAFKVGLGTKIVGKSEEFANAEFAEYNAKRYHQPSDEFNENWDFASLEYAARYGFTIGLNAANLEAMPRWNAGDEFAVSPR
jgi:hypothetical protein